MLLECILEKLFILFKLKLHRRKGGKNREQISWLKVPQEPKEEEGWKEEFESSCI